MGIPAPDKHYRMRPRSKNGRRQAQERAMWQVHAAFRLGDYRTPELDVTPAIGLTLIAAVVALIIQTGCEMRKVTPYLANGCPRTCWNCGKPFSSAQGAPKRSWATTIVCIVDRSIASRRACSARPCVAAREPLETGRVTTDPLR
jgi:hypothetical protein